MRYRISGWFGGSHVRLCWDDGRLQGPEAVLAATIAHGAEWTGAGVVRLDDHVRALTVIGRVLDDIDAVVLSADEPVFELRRRRRRVVR